MKKNIIIIALCVITLGIAGCEKNITNNIVDVSENETSEKKSFVIIDEVAENGEVCPSALEEFYEDENYRYSWSCMKNDAMIVKYEDGTTKLVSEALADGDIQISDLDENNIKYYKSEKTR